jgi:hypothetical protein
MARTDGHVLRGEMRLLPARGNVSPVMNMRWSDSSNEATTSCRRLTGSAGFK